MNFLLLNIVAVVTVIIENYLAQIFTLNIITAGLKMILTEVKIAVKYLKKQVQVILSDKLNLQKACKSLRYEYFLIGKNGGDYALCDRCHSFISWVCLNSFAFKKSDGFH